MSPEVLIQDPDIDVDSGLREELIPKSALPCGMIACKALSEGCIYKGRFANSPEAGEVVQVLCETEQANRLLVTENNALEARVDKQSGEIQLLTNDIEAVARDLDDAIIELREMDAISRDKVTGLLKAEHFELLLQNLDKEKELERIAKSDGSLLLGFFDLNKLGQHNDLGGHRGGDEALAAFSDALTSIYGRGNVNAMRRRKSDVEYARMNLNTAGRHTSFIRSGVKSSRPCDMIFRIGGDEFIVMSYVPYSISCPQTSDKYEREQWLACESERVQFRLSNIKCSYLTVSEDGRVSDNKLNQDGQRLDVELSKAGSIRKATVPVTSTFGLGLIDRPTSMNVKDMIIRLSQANISFKKTRNDLSTQGIVLSE